MAEDMIRLRIGITWDRFARASHEKTVTVSRQEWEQMDREERADFMDQERDDLLDAEVRTWAYVEGEVQGHG